MTYTQKKLVLFFAYFFICYLLPAKEWCFLEFALNFQFVFFIEQVFNFTIFVGAGKYQLNLWGFPMQIRIYGMTFIWWDTYFQGNDLFRLTNSGNKYVDISAFFEISNRFHNLQTTLITNKMELKNTV